MSSGGWYEGEKKRKRPRMCPRPSCSVSNMALVPLRKKREAEQINTGRRIPSIFFTSLPTWIKGRRGMQRVSTQNGGTHVVLFMRSSASYRPLSKIRQRDTSVYVY